MIHHFSKKISPKMITIVQAEINKISNDIIMNSFNSQILDDHEINNIIQITKNNNDEIIAVDFDLEKAYAISLNISNNIKKSLNNVDDQKFIADTVLISKQKDGFILFIPLGISSDNIYLANLGPKIPVKVRFIGNLITGLKTKVQNYGINNALIEIYMKITLNEEILIPFVDKKINNNCEILLSSQMVEGIVPSIYNGLLENNSSLINVPLNN